MLKKILDDLSIRRDLKLFSNIPFVDSITYVDVGAAGGLRDRWVPYRQWLNYVGFEPIEQRALELLNNQNNFKQYTIIQNAIWDKNQEIDLNITEGSNESSLMVPNMDFVNGFVSPERFEIRDKVKLKAARLDDCVDRPVDFLKIDVQGATGQVLGGAENSLVDILALEIEVEFFEVYKNQFRFSDVQNYLKKYDLELECFTDLISWNRASVNANTGKLVHGDVLFIRKPDEVIQRSKDNIHLLGKYLAILSIYRQYDLIRYCVSKSKLADNIDTSPLMKILDVNQKYLKFFDNLSNKVARLAGPGTTNYISF